MPAELSVSPQMTAAQSTPDRIRREHNLGVLRHLESYARNELTRLTPLDEALPSTADWQLIGFGWDLGLDAAALFCLR